MGRFVEERARSRTPRSTAELAVDGVGRGTLRGARYERTSKGYHRPVDQSDPSLTSTQRILDARAAIPAGALIAGWAAAYVHGVDNLDGLDDHSMQPLPVSVLLPPGQHRRDTAGIHYRQSKRPIRGVVIEDVPVTMRVRTALDLARTAPELTEAVVALDAFLGLRSFAVETLANGAERLPSRRGIRQAERAVELARVGVKSTWETRLRMFAALELGLTDLQVNRAVFDRKGDLLGVPDLLDVEAGLAIEYDGATWRSAQIKGHRDQEQHRQDNAREERLERAGLIVVRAEKADLSTHRVRLVERIRAAHRDGLDRDRSRDRWTLDEPSDFFGFPA